MISSTTGPSEQDTFNGTPIPTTTTSSPAADEEVDDEDRACWVEWSHRQDECHVAYTVVGTEDGEDERVDFHFEDDPPKESSLPYEYSSSVHGGSCTPPRSNSPRYTEDVQFEDEDDNDAVSSTRSPSSTLVSSTTELEVLPIATDEYEVLGKPTHGEETPRHESLPELETDVYISQATPEGRTTPTVNETSRSMVGFEDIADSYRMKTKAIVYDNNKEEMDYTVERYAETPATAHQGDGMSIIEYEDYCYTEQQNGSMSPGGRPSAYNVCSATSLTPTEEPYTPGDFSDDEGDVPGVAVVVRMERDQEALPSMTFNTVRNLAQQHILAALQNAPSSEQETSTPVSEIIEKTPSPLEELQSSLDSMWIGSDPQIEAPENLALPPLQVFDECEDIPVGLREFARDMQACYQNPSMSNYKPVTIQTPVMRMSATPCASPPPSPVTTWSYEGVPVTSFGNRQPVIIQIPATAHAPAYVSPHMASPPPPPPPPPQPLILPPLMASQSSEHPLNYLPMTPSPLRSARDGLVSRSSNLETRPFLATHVQEGLTRSQCDLRQPRTSMFRYNPLAKLAGQKQADETLTSKPITPVAQQNIRLTTTAPLAPIYQSRHTMRPTTMMTLPERTATQVCGGSFHSRSSFTNSAAPAPITRISLPSASISMLASPKVTQWEPNSIRRCAESPSKLHVAQMGDASPMKFCPLQPLTHMRVSSTQTSHDASSPTYLPAPSPQSSLRKKDCIETQAIHLPPEDDRRSVPSPQLLPLSLPTPPQQQQQQPYIVQQELSPSQSPVEKTPASRVQERVLASDIVPSPTQSSTVAPPTANSMIYQSRSSISKSSSFHPYGKTLSGKIEEIKKPVKRKSWLSCCLVDILN